MNHHFNDIRSRIAEPPTWFDENGTPRYCPFSPNETASVYADEVVLLRVACQNCGREFDVCMSWSTFDKVISGATALSTLIGAHKIHYGDPPNVGCCPAGPTMNSIPLRVLGFWRRGKATDPDWTRMPEMEIAVVPDWAEDVVCNVDHTNDQRPAVLGGECSACLHRPPLHEATCPNAWCECEETT